MKPYLSLLNDLFIKKMFASEGKFNQKSSFYAHMKKVVNFIPRLCEFAMKFVKMFPDKDLEKLND